MRESRWTVWALILWTLAGVLLAFFERPLFDALWIGAGLIILMFIILGACLLLVVAGYAIWRRNLIAAVSAFGFIISGLGLWYAEPFLRREGDAALFRYRFMTSRALYDRIVDDAERARAGHSYGERDGVRFQVDAGPPVRVAFPQPGGIIDNWEGVIYDPTGEVLKARGWAEPGAVSAPPGVKELFGGDLVSCRHVEGNYYRCWFT